VSEIGYGMWGMGGWSGSDDEESMRALRRSVELGCNFFDTAWAYGEGKSDALLGELLAEKRSEARGEAGPTRKELYAASKIPPLNRKWPASGQDKYSDVFPEAHVLQYADLIRAKLGVAAIDVLQFHVWSDAWAGETEFRRTVERLKSEGKIRAFGLSLNRWEPENGIVALRTGLVDAVQVIYNIFDQAPEDKLFPICREMNIGVIARVPLDEGSLGGNMTRQTRFPASDWRSKYFGPENLSATMDRVDKLRAVLPPGTSLPEMALRFILSHPAVSTTIVGMRSPDHVRQDLVASDAGPLDGSLLAGLRPHRWDRKPQRWSD